MMIVKLSGGLGNQMFQYAMGRSVAMARSIPLFLDLSFYTQQHLRTYQLGAFSVQESFATPEDVAKVRGTCYRHIRRRIFLLRHTWFRPYHKQPVFRERRGFEYDAHVFEAPRDVYFSGYWQNWRYFVSIEDVIRREFSLRRGLSDAGRKLASLVDARCSVAVHVRRGDYVADPNNRACYGSCGPEYYRKAAALMRIHVGVPHFFVFSDEPEWARDNLRFLHPMTIVRRDEGRADYEDVAIMGMCKHFVIANSSFSWWGAWLGSDAGKVVVAPGEWLRGDAAVCTDMTPPTWQRV